MFIGANHLLAIVFPPGIIINNGCDTFQWTRYTATIYTRPRTASWAKQLFVFVNSIKNDDGHPTARMNVYGIGARGFVRPVCRVGRDFESSATGRAAGSEIKWPNGAEWVEWQREIIGLTPGWITDKPCWPRQECTVLSSSSLRLGQLI